VSKDNGGWQPQRANWETGDAHANFANATRMSRRDPQNRGKLKERVLMVINTNMAAINSATNLNNSTNMLNNALAQLSSGSKIVSPADNPAGLAESIALTATIGQTQAANSNVSNALSFSQTQDGYLQQVGSALDQMATLAVEAQDPTKSASELSGYQSEFSALSSYINNAASATFNGVTLFASGGLTVTTDGNGTGNSTFSMAAINLGASVYSGLASQSVTSSATAALTAVTAAITQLATDRASIGANEERLT
jgi:flagellin